MNPGLQSSLFDTQGSVALRPLAPERTDLGSGAWVDIQPGWLEGADELFAALVEGVPWQAEKRKMYDRVVAVPRLLSYYRENVPLPHPVLAAAREALSKHYLRELREPFRTAGLCYYRDGRDSVAWHGDRIGRGAREDTMVAILSVGAARNLALRPRGGGGKTPGSAVGARGSARDGWELPADLGAFGAEDGQAVGPRIRIQFRPRGVN